jgi:hypothetical protein
MSSGTETITMTAADYATALARFVTGETLKVIPARRNAKLVVFAWLVERFEPERRYTEAEVNRELLRAHADYATIRRGLYDEHFMDRADGRYWRTPAEARLQRI